MFFHLQFSLLKISLRRFGSTSIYAIIHITSTHYIALSQRYYYIVLLVNHYSYSLNVINHCSRFKPSSQFFSNLGCIVFCDPVALRRYRQPETVKACGISLTRLSGVKGLRENRRHTQIEFPPSKPHTARYPISCALRFCSSQSESCKLMDKLCI